MPHTPPSAGGAPPEAITRRPLKTRSRPWAGRLAQALVRLGLTPNQVSLISILMAVIGAACFAFAIRAPVPARALLLIAAAACIQLRLLCNLIDGMMAVEGGRRTPTGEIYNELPDRISDVLFLVAAGYAGSAGAWSMELGWIAAILAILTAYIRALGASLGFPPDYGGPMAKPHRMFTLTLASLAAAIECFWRPALLVIPLALAVIALGAVLTCIRRVRRLALSLTQPRRLGQP